MGDFLEEMGELASDAVDAIGDAGEMIGNFLKSVAPFLSTIPGFGSALSFAVYAAGALAAKDKITDGMIGAASAAMTPGLPRIAFDGAANITRDVADGRSVKDSALSACRQAAEASGPQAVEAFDSAVAVINNGGVDEQLLLAQGRALAQQNGDIAAASYEAAVKIAQGDQLDEAFITAAREYINRVGGAPALAAFDTAIALGHGKTLQEAGYIGLHTFARGNKDVEKIMNFLERAGDAKLAGLGLQQLLESELGTDLLYAIHNAGVRVDENAIEPQLDPYLDAIRQNPKLLDLASGQLATQLNVNEAIIRAAQALMRRGDGTIDQRLLATFKGFAEVAQQSTWGQSWNFSEEDAAANELLAIKGRQIINVGAKWRGRLLSDIRKRSTFTMTPRADLTDPTIQVPRGWDITDAWRRSFDIGIGTAEGTSYPEDLHINAVVRRRLASNTGGFDAGEAIQFERTRSNRKFGGSDILSAQSIVGLAGVVVETGEDTIIARHAAIVIRSVEKRDEVLLDDPATTRNRAKWMQIMTRKSLSIFAIPPGDKPKLIDPIAPEPPAKSIRRS
jgi:hypothetical protein